MVTAAENLIDLSRTDTCDASVSSLDTIKTSGGTTVVDSGSQATAGTWAGQNAFWNRYAHFDRHFALVDSAGISGWLNVRNQIPPDSNRSTIRWYEIADGYLVDRTTTEIRAFESSPLLNLAWMGDDDPAITPLEASAFSTDADVGWHFSPFDILDGRAERSVHDEIELVSQLHRSDANDLRDRLSELLEISVDEAELRVLSPGSVRACRQFLSTYPRIKTPALFLTDSGALRAQWTYAQNQGLAVLFQPDGVAEYVVFAPDQRRPSITNDHAGSASWQSLLPSLSQNSELDWLFES